MHCASCGFENPSGFAFCGQCGTPLARQLAVASSQLSVASPQHLTPNPKQKIVEWALPTTTERLLWQERWALPTLQEKRKLRDVFSKPLPSLASSKQNPGNCGRH